MTDHLPDPFVPADVDLRAWPFMPLYAGRLFGSAFHARASDAAWRAGVTLWLKSWHQLPAGTLPTDDVELARLAEFGRDMKAWGACREWALHGWVQCSDGRLHHPVLAAIVLETWEKRKQNKDQASHAARVRWDRERAGSNAGSNAAGNAGSNAGAMPKNAKRKEEKGREGSEAKASAEKGPSSNPSDWLWAEGLAWLLANTARKEGPIRSFIGKCRASLKNDDAKLRQIIEQAMANNPAEPFGWISAAIQSRNPPEPEPAEGDYLTEADHQLVRMFGAIATDVLNFKRSGAWYSFQGPRPDDPASKIDPVILSKHGYADPEIYAGWYRKLNGSAP